MLGSCSHETPPLRQRAVASALVVTVALVVGTSTAATATVTASGATPRRSHCSPVRRGGTARALTTDASSAVAHDTETEALVAQSGRSRGDGPMGVPRPFGVRTGPGQEVEDRSVVALRADAVSSGPGAGLLPGPSDQGLGSGPLPPRDSGHRRRALQDPVVARRCQLVFPSQFVCSPGRRRCRCVRGARVGWGLVQSMPGFGRRGSFKVSGRLLVALWCSIPSLELSVAPPGSPGAVTQKVTGFADCGGALYTTINTTLYRRNDGTLPSGIPRWVPVYRAPPVGPAHNSGLRGITCVSRVSVGFAAPLDGGQRQRVPLRRSAAGPARHRRRARVRVPVSGGLVPVLCGALDA